jgi:predicted amino acid-binding ACT domain protein
VENLGTSNAAQLCLVSAQSTNDFIFEQHAYKVVSLTVNVLFLHSMPMYMRIPCVATTSLVWTCVLSAMRGGDLAHKDDMLGGAVTGATLVIMKEGLESILTSPAGDLERDRTHVVITASGRDKSGWVAALSRAVANEGGNVTHSKMVRLGHDFIIQMHVSVPPEKSRLLLKSLKRNVNLKGLDIQSNSIARRGTGSFEAPQMSFHIRCVGADK